MNPTRELSVRTFGNDDHLPRVPLPSLAESCQRFLAWCEPLLTPTEQAQTAQAVAEFTRPDGAGPTLHQALVEYDAQPSVRSWLDTFWPYRYLGRRDRIALNANFFFLFNDAPAPTTQVERAAALITASVDYKLRLDAELIPPVVQRGQPLSMEQTKYLFSATRIPGPIQDTVRVPYSDQWPGPSAARHIVVLVRGSMFSLDVIDPAGQPYPVGAIVGALNELLYLAQQVGEGPGVGHLTTMARAEWAARRAALITASPVNAAALDTVETALFCLCLSPESPVDTLAAGDELLHGDSGSRWFDKALSFIVFADGRAGLNVEHCGLDGTTVLGFVDAILGRPGATADPAGPPASPEDQPATPPENPPTAAPGHFLAALPGVGPAVAPVGFELTDPLRQDIAAAAAAFAQYAADTATTIVALDDFGADTAKALGISPDAFVQLCFQLAHQRAKGHLGTTYESIATRQYQNGRTEAMRVVTPEIVQFVAAVEDPQVGRPTRQAAARSAAEAHVRRARECQVGQAPEQHLWELLLIQHRRGAELGVPQAPALYQSPGWLIMRDDYLSTSSAPSVNIQFFGFGSTSSRCIGVAYLLGPDRFNIYLSTPQPVVPAMFTFARELRAAITDLTDLLTD